MTPTSLTDLITTPPSDRRTAVFLDHVPFGERVILHGELPYLDAPATASYYGQAQGMLNSDATVIDVGALYDAVLASNADLRTAMGTRSRTGYALRTMLADDSAATVTARILTATSHTSRVPFLLRLPSPLIWLAQAAEATGNTDFSSITADHAESAAMYVADWLRRFVDAPVVGLILDGRRAGAYAELPPEDIDAYQPVINAAEHIGWSVLLQTEGGVEVAGEDVRGATIDPGYWLGTGTVPQADFLVTQIPAEAEPETVLERLEAL
ncbi:hypothetical protein M0E87_07545 [Corynebacterium sp. CCM 9185]|uniref:Uncharacterized protein n=1 Tax=Corynebacterium marambiense TaxID=2765364 RepID=A0ABS0VTR1_9CORY|nr:hypothetical protein [Corynebacterium marambiense]MBI9000160.1 hypothetical protein [Corynebacterium marambiense]MCK7663514.1 hypothetical protein [Corynebacterium marambiense]MCX7542052.1 hypothetical protein [Corynebacterium marambiense]